MTTMFSLTEDYKGKSLALFYADGGSETIPETHVSFQPVIDLLMSGKATDEEIQSLTNVKETIARKMSALSERVSIDGTDVYFDGDPLAGELTEVIKGLFAEGNTDFKPLVNFLEKCKQNPSQQSVDDLYRWIKKGDLVIDPDGDIIAYKGVGKDSKGMSQSIHKGKAFVDGVEYSGHIPNRPGTVVSMARSLVVDDPHIGCSVGLHAGTHAYAMTFLNWNNETRMILVKINPRDVVSVPVDEANQKMRVARYTVLSEIEARLKSAYFQPELEEDEDEDEDEDYDYNDDYDYEGDFLEDDEEDDEWDEEAEAEEARAMEAAYNDPAGNYPDLADWEKELLGVTTPKAEEARVEETKEEEAPEEDSSLSDELREALQRFTGTNVPAKRDSNGRFIL